MYFYISKFNENEQTQLLEMCGYFGIYNGNGTYFYSLNKLIELLYKKVADI